VHLKGEFRGHSPIPHLLGTLKSVGNLQ
jgi:hypothetical protein